MIISLQYIWGKLACNVICDMANITFTIIVNKNNKVIMLSLLGMYRIAFFTIWPEPDSAGYQNTLSSRNQIVVTNMAGN